MTTRATETFADFLRGLMTEWDAATPEQRERMLATVKRLADATEAAALATR